MDFKNTILIMTSNIGSEYLLNGVNKSNQEKVEQELKAHFKPEFLNRIDDIVFFNPLDEKVVEKIVNKFIHLLETRLGKLEISIALTNNALKQIAEEGFDPIYGARPIKRFIQKEIETPLSKEIIVGHIMPKQKVEVDYQNNHFIFK